MILTQHRIMDWQVSLWFLIPAVFILLLVFPIFVEVRVSFNPLLNRGVIALFVFRFKIFHFIFSFHGKFIELENEKTSKMQELQFESQQFEFIQQFMKQIKDKTRLKKLYVFYNIGTGDAFSSAMVCGIINQILTQIFLILKNKKPTASLCVFDTVSYNKEVCEVVARSAISISFFDVAYSFIISVILTKNKQ